jgi:hypothetical protein
MKRSEAHGLIIAKYVDAGWSAVPAPKGSVNDVIAHIDNKLHFVSIESERTDPEGLVKNTFIQNAFSNGAVPVYARVVGSKVTLCDINLNTRILIGKKRTMKTEAAKENAKGAAKEGTKGAAKEGTKGVAAKGAAKSTK